MFALMIFKKVPIDYVKQPRSQCYSNKAKTTQHISHKT